MSDKPRPPKSIEEIVQDASNFDHDTSYPLRIALRTAQSMLNQAANYERDGNAEAAYLFYYRHAEFYFSQIAKHPDAKTSAEFKPALARVRKEVNQDIARLEVLKPELKRRHERYQELMRRRSAPRQAAADGKGEAAAQHAVLASESPSQSFDGSDSLVLNAGRHNELALMLANRELRRIDASRQEHGDANMDDLSNGIRAIGMQLDGSKSRHTEDSNSKTPLASRYNYPTVPQSRDLSLAPTLPPKSAISAISSPPLVPSKAPALPSKHALDTSLPSSTAPTLPPKTEDLSSTSYTFESSAKTEGGLPLRTLFLPTAFRSSFLSIAAKNTASNLETCAILCGSLISNAFFISRLVVPDQISTSDTCEVTEQGDVDLFDHVDGQGLTVCGWIHTHPSQTCFLSSRDLHTSVGYQVMLPESVAIVCAPSKSPDHGIFRLTDPTGKNAILSCNQPGIFHPHAQTNLYTDALRPGHVCELDGLQFEVVDLRAGRG
ncbi:hypothetical protein AAFC00_004128 [Neodothiora populina]|uniref:MPN domain-containing protein n=1 Tax=Neodothiora populina TaxID=2781224 RepID=A0ABR3PJQ8_9PEZI